MHLLSHFNLILYAASFEMDGSYDLTTVDSPIKTFCMEEEPNSYTPGAYLHLLSRFSFINGPT